MNEAQIVKDIVILKEDVAKIKETMVTKQDIGEIRSLLETMVTSMDKMQKEQVFVVQWVKHLDKKVENHNQDITTIKGVLQLA